MYISLAQLNPTIGDLVGNAQQIQAAAETAAAQGSRLLLTPELSLCGYPPRDLLLNPGFVGAAHRQLQALAAQLPPDLAVLVGTVSPNPQADRLGEKPLFNSVALVQGGRVQQVFHKRLLPTYDVFDEDRYFAPGRESHEFVFELGAFSLGHSASLSPGLSPNSSPNLSPTLSPGTTADRPVANPPTSIKIGVTICEDFWNEESFWGKRSYPHNPIADLAHQGVDLIINLSASPYTVGKQQLRQAMLTHGAQWYGLPIIYVNQVGGNDDLIFDGRSMVLDRSGLIISRAPGFTPALLTVCWDAQRRDWASPGTANSPTLSPDGSPNLSSDLSPELSTNPSPNLSPPSPPSPGVAGNSPIPTFHSAIAPLEDCPEAEIWAALVLGVRDYSRKCGFKRIVLGLSGGIDSALVATIAAAALGAPQVLAVLMPSPYSSDHSISDAIALAQTLGIPHQQIPIAPVMEGFDQSLGELFAGLEPDVTEENLQSRIRGTLLMAIANKFGHLLISTGNKSEMAVGYCTLYGDMDGGLAAIADVPKTQVYRLCQWINGAGNQTIRQQLAALDPTFTPIQSSDPLIPVHILTKPPSAELKPGQVDQDSLPDYDILDQVLDRLIHQHQSCEEIIAAGFDGAMVQKVWRLVVRSEFKRRQAPPGLKITDRAFGTGWRMPIASRW
jgi:NAD+ synthase (glutamine-hydrolysing)